MYENFLTQLGLTKDQAAVYEILIKNGAYQARKRASKTGIKRSLVYKVIDQLIEMGLIEKKDKPGQIAVFYPAHPGQLKKIFEKEEQKIETVKTVLNGNIGQLVSDFNLLSGKPNVQFYEGIKGVKSVLEDSLYTKTEVYSYADAEAVDKYIADINTWYVGQREKNNVKKKILLIDSPFNRKYLAGYHPGVTEVKLVKHDAPPFQAIMQMYDNKISYITLSDTDMIGVIIEDPRIYIMHKFMFEHLWNITAMPLLKEESPAKNEE